MERNTNLFFLFITALTAFLIFITNCIYIVDQRQSALVLQFGEPVREVSTPGLKLKIPLIQNVVFFDKRIQSARFIPGTSDEVIAMDQKTMKLDAYAKYKITEPLKFYRTTLNENRFKMRLIPIIESSIREAVGSVLFTELFGDKRAALVQQITNTVRDQVKSFGVDVVDVKIIRINLPDKTRNAVYERMRTERDKEAREIRAIGFEESDKIRAIGDKEKVTLVAEAKGKASAIKGEGEAEAAKALTAVALLDPEFFEFYRYMQAYKNTFRKENTNIILYPDNEFFSYFNSTQSP